MVFPQTLPAALQTEWMRYADDYQRICTATASLKLPYDIMTWQQEIARVWAGSEFVADSVIRYPDLLIDLCTSGDLFTPYGESIPTVSFEAIQNSLFKKKFTEQVRAIYDAKLIPLLKSVTTEPELKTVLRQFRRREMVRIMWRDLTDKAGLLETCRDLSALADSIVCLALQKLYDWHTVEWGTPYLANGQPMPLWVIALGKLGGEELNVSSDIDIMFVYAEAGETQNGPRTRSHNEFFTVLAQRLVQTLHTVTADGFVFRVDLRLRPHGDSGPVVMSVAALEDYYQREGREWERYALIKARLLNSDETAAHMLMGMLRPFVYRRYVDFGVIESLREMKALIREEVKRKGLEDNIKLGWGGIREIEFIAQAFQLARGGRNPILCERSLLCALFHLMELRCLSRTAAQELLAAYVFLREVEHCLQAVSDQQTQTLPTHELGRARLAYSMGYADWPALNHALTQHRQRVQKHFEKIAAVPPPTTPTQVTEVNVLQHVWQEIIEPEESLTALQKAGFADSEHVLTILQTLRESVRYRSLRPVAKGRLDKLMPHLLLRVGQSAAPTLTLSRILNLIEAILQRSAYLSLLFEHPSALEQLVHLCSESSFLAEELTTHPLLLDELLDPRQLYAPLSHEELVKECDALLSGEVADDLEQQMEGLRQFKRVHVLRVAAADITQALPLMRVSDKLTEIAEVVLKSALEICWRALVARYGLPEGVIQSNMPQGFAIIGYGKLGGIELGYNSDLDLVFLYDSALGKGKTRGPRIVDNQEFFIRLTQRLLHFLSTHTRNGVLYAIDTRLRPSGEAGLLVSSIANFAEYQEKEAWIWEHQALVRARCILGQPELMQVFNQIRQDILARRRDVTELTTAVQNMRERMRQQWIVHSAEFDLKQGQGGIIDLEFFVQYMVLRFAHEHPSLATYSDNIRILEAMGQAGLLATADAEALCEAYRNYRKRLHHLVLQQQPAVVPESEFEEERQLVMHVWEIWCRSGA